MRFQTLAHCALVGSWALEAAAGPVPAPVSGNGVSAVREARSRKQQPEARHVVPAHTGTHIYTHSKRDIPNTHTLHERQPPHWSRSWTPTKRVPGDAMLPMRIGLRQRNLDEGHDRLMAIADPNSPSYGKHMTSKEVVDFFAPERASVDAVVAWLTGAGVHIDRISQSANKQWIQFDATAAEAEELLMTEYHVFEHGQTGTRDVAADHYHLPHSVRAHVDYVTPGIRLRRDTGKANQLKRRQQIEQQQKTKRGNFQPHHTNPQPVDVVDSQSVSPPPANLSTCYEFVTPDCIRNQYNIPLGKRAAKGNELGIFESLDQHYSKEDLDNYFSIFAPFIPKGTYPIDELIDGAIGAVSVADAGGEAELDFQASMPLIYPQKTVLFQVDDERIQLNETLPTTPYLGFWNTFFDAIDGSYCKYSAFGETGNCVKPECLDPSYPDPGPGGYSGSLQCGVYKPTNVISISYGGGEADLPAYYWQRQCSEILKLTLQGVTVVISSGDEGVASYQGDGGHADGCGGANGQVFYPASEATCPYVLAVGSTEFDLAAPATSSKRSLNSSTTASAPPPKLTERSTTQFGSGGGFSNYFPAPAYQWAAVAEYFAQVQLPFQGYFNAGNNFSDVGSGVYHIGGRGYPDVSAIGAHYLLLFNGQWATVGGTSLAAPVWASVLTLVNEERLARGKGPVGFVNPVLYANPEVFNDITVGNNPGCGTDGFPAARGWDPVSGLGSPNYPKLLTLLENLP